MQWLIDICKSWIQLYLKGMIVLWSGAIIDIPDGWQLCDGTNGTPDLRNRFVPGAGDTYAVGANGDVSTHGHLTADIGHTHEPTLHDHNITGHTHTHNHALRSSGFPIGTINVTSGDEPVGHETHTHDVDLPPISSSSEPLTTDEGGLATKTGFAIITNPLISHIPPYYALAYIMKL